jgi:hypothetical protein
VGNVRVDVTRAGAPAVLRDVTVVNNSGTWITIVPVWPTAVGMEIVVVIMAVALGGRSEVTVVNCGGICSTTVPVWPTAVGAAIVATTGEEAPTEPRDVSVVNS